MTSFTFNPWPFQVSASAAGTLSGNVASLKTSSIDVGALVWDALIKTNALRAAEIRSNAPEALV